MQAVRIVFLEKNELNQYTIRAIDEYNKESKNTIEYIYAETLLKKSKEYKYQLLNSLVGACEKFSEENLLIVFLGENSCILNFDCFLYYISRMNMKEYMFGFRIENIKGIAFKGSPRLPFIDDSIIVLNKRKFKESGLIEKKLINACHFFKYAKNKALLQSLIEYSLDSNDFVNLINEKRIKDEFGNQCKYNFPLPFCLCTESSVTNVDLAYNPKYKTLLSINYINFLNSRKVVFFKSSRLKGFLLGAIQKLSNLWNTFSNKEFKKTYNE